MKLPKVGMPVQFWPSEGESLAKTNNNDGPVAAIITRVWSNDMVNIMVLPDCGIPFSITSVHIGSDPRCWDFIPE